MTFENKKNRFGYRKAKFIKGLGTAVLGVTMLGNVAHADELLKDTTTQSINGQVVLQYIDKETGETLKTIEVINKAVYEIYTNTYYTTDEDDFKYFDSVEVEDKKFDYTYSTIPYKQQTFTSNAGLSYTLDETVVDGLEEGHLQYGVHEVKYYYSKDPNQEISEAVPNNYPTIESDVATLTVEENSTKEVISFETIRIAKDDLFLGEEETISGTNGERTIVNQLTKVNGEIVKTEEISNTITTQPINEIIYYGTRSSIHPTHNKDDNPINNLTIENIERKEVIPFNTVRVKADELFIGEEEIIDGVNGERTITNKITKNGNVIVSSEEISNLITIQPKDKIIKVGTKKPIEKVPNVSPEVILEEINLVEEEVTTKEIIPFNTERIETNELFIGEEEVSDGVNGERTIIRRTYKLNNELIKSDEISNTITIQPKNRIVKVGTKKPIESVPSNFPTISLENSNIIEEEISHTEIVPFEIERIETDELFVGREEIIDGVNGERTIVNKVVKVDGQIVKTEELSNIITINPKNKIIKVGTKQENEDSPEDNPRVVLPVLPKDELSNIIGKEAKSDGTILDGLKVGDTFIDGSTIVELPDLSDIGGNALYIDLKKRYSDKELFEKAQSPIEKHIVIRDKNGQLWYQFLGVSNNVVKTFNETEELIDQRKLNKYFLEYLNAERASKGLKPLHFTETLLEPANTRSQELANYGHIRVDGKKHVRLNGDKWNTVLEGVTMYWPYYVGENVLAQNVLSNPFHIISEKSIAKEAFRQWKESKGHYDNMMDPDYKYSVISAKVATREASQNPTKNNWIIVTQILAMPEAIDGKNP